MAAFVDTNVLLYLISADTRKAAIAEEVLRAGGHVSPVSTNGTDLRL